MFKIQKVVSMNSLRKMIANFLSVDNYIIWTTNALNPCFSVKLPVNYNERTAFTVWTNEKKASPFSLSIYRSLLNKYFKRSIQYRNPWRLAANLHVGSSSHRISKGPYQWQYISNFKMQYQKNNFWAVTVTTQKPRSKIGRAHVWTPVTL